MVSPPAPDAGRLSYLYRREPAPKTCARRGRGLGRGSWHPDLLARRSPLVAAAVALHVAEVELEADAEAAGPQIF